MEEKKQTRQEKIQEKIQEKKEDIAYYNERISEYKECSKAKKLPRKEKAVIKKEIRELKSARFGVKHPVLSFVKEIGGMLFEAMVETGEQLERETKQNYDSLSPFQKGVVFYTAVELNPIAAVEVTNMMGKYNSQTQLSGLKEKTENKENEREY